MSLRFGAQEASRYVYLDYAATAPLCEEAAAAMAPYFVPGRENLAAGGNANSLHSPGREAFSQMEAARKALAGAIGAKRAQEVVFTSGATEADCAAIEGLAQAQVEKRHMRLGSASAPMVVVSAIEHDAVLAPAKRLEAQGYRVVRLAPNAQGVVEPEALSAAITPETVLVSVQLANSEAGSIQPVGQLARIAHSAGAVFHTDATQALGKMPLNVQELGVDAASFSAHKVGGPKGIGALYLKARTPFSAFMLGGGQEGGLRSGTQNVAGMAGFAAAAQAACSMADAEAARLAALRDKVYAAAAGMRGVRATVPEASGNAGYLPNIVHLLVQGIESETLILQLDKAGFGVSGGSACSSHSLEPSHVLSAMGIPADAALGALRVSMGRYTTENDVDAFLRALPDVLDWGRGR